MSSGGKSSGQVPELRWPRPCPLAGSFLPGPGVWVGAGYTKESCRNVYSDGVGRVLRSQTWWRTMAVAAELEDSVNISLSNGLYMWVLSSEETQSCATS